MKFFDPQNLLVVTTATERSCNQPGRHSSQVAELRFTPRSMAPEADSQVTMSVAGPGRAPDSVTSRLPLQIYE